MVRVTVFSPDDLALVKEGPALRRRFLDETAVGLHPRADADRRDLERILKHKSTLLKQVGGRLSEDAAFTLDVWDVKLAEVGERIGRTRAEVVAALGPQVARAYVDLADGASAAEVEVRYDPPGGPPGWPRRSPPRRPTRCGARCAWSGPHRDDLELRLNGLPARTHASQGEQRTLALALRLAAHRLVAERVDDPPVLVLDDVFSELDPARSAALLRHLPPGQVLLTTAGPLPPGAAVERTIHVEQGRLDGMSAWRERPTASGERCSRREWPERPRAEIDDGAANRGRSATASTSSSAPCAARAPARSPACSPAGRRLSARRSRRTRGPPRSSTAA